MAPSGIQPVAASPVSRSEALDTRRLATTQRLGRVLDAQDPAAARLAATQMVSELFFKPLLAEVRESSCGAAFIDGGQTESVFGEQLDQRLADTVAGQQSGLIDQIAATLNQTSWRTRLQAAATETSQ